MNISLDEAIQAIDASITVENTVDVLKNLQSQVSKTAKAVSYGVTGGGSARKKANKAAKDILNRVGTDHRLLTEEDKEVLRKYSGLGGIGGSVHEYYTPDYVAGGIWDAMQVNGFSNGNVGEPSAGAGVFNGTKPDGVIITGSEMDATSSQINQLLHPEDKIFHKTFEQLTQIVPDSSFDGFVGNVPFSRSRSTAHDDPEYANIKQAERYFVTRMLDKLKHEKLMCVVVPTQIISRESWSKWREEISRKGEFLGAHRLPAGVFKDNGTDVVTDVLVMRKHSEETLEKITDLDDALLYESNLLYKPFIDGKYFKTPEGKRFIHGDEDKVKGQFGSLQDTVKKDASFSKEGLKAKLARKFDSRIDWQLLELAEPVVRNFADGDQRKINGRWYELKNNDWQLIESKNDSDDLPVARYGVESKAELITLINSGTSELLKLDFEQLEAIFDDYEYLFENNPRALELYHFAKSYPSTYHERLLRGGLIGESIIELQNIATQSRKVPTAHAAQLRELVSAEIEKYGIAADDGKIALLTGKNANPWNAFSSATDKDGNFSDLLKGTLDVGETKAFDTSDASQVINHLHTQFDLNPVPFEEFEKLYTGDDAPKTLADVAKLDGVAITFDGNLMPFDRACAGDIAKQTARLRNALGEHWAHPDISNNFQRQLDEIERKRKRNTDKEIEFTLNAKWIPRKYVLEFMKEAGYYDFAYIKAVEDEEGEVYRDTEYQGEDGVFVGYTQKVDGTKRSANANISFERQLENHLNGLPVRSKDKSAAARMKDRIKVIEQEFADFIRQHDDVDELVDKYNDVFNGYIPFEHSNADLNLSVISDEVKLMDYQNAAIRRLSEDGRGVLGFGTGLGKTFTALGLEAYNRELGRSKRTAIVVPKSVLENWYHEIKAFYGRGNMGSILIPAIDAVTNKDGAIEQELVLDENGEAKLNPHTGKKQYRDKIKVVSNTKSIKERLAKIPQSNYNVVVLTKEQYSKLPLRPESVAAHVADRVSVGALKGKYVANANKYREAQKNESFKAKYSDVGTKKYDDVPYFEDMGFDTVIVDEGHNYRNSYAAGYNASRLAYLPTSQSSDVAVDMALKSEYLRKKNGGRGTVLLTATPTVNSPTDIYNMLSLIISPEEWSQMGIADVDDFIELYGETAMESITKLSGEVEEQEALVGFKNLSGLRNLFHRWVNLKNAKDVSKTVKIPKLNESKVNVELTEEQQSIYEELRQRADELNDDTKQIDIELPDGTVAQMDVPNGDSVFRIIRDMDRVTTDLDLYYRTMSFVLPEKHHDKLKELIEQLPESIALDVKQEGKEADDAESEKHTVSHNAKLGLTGNSIKLVVHEAYEDVALELMTKLGIKESEVSHPVMPKYAQLIELVKTGLKDGKQIIFTEEKSQHNKLKRILAHQLNMDSGKVGIINADTVAGKKKKASADEQEAGLEAIANAYNTGKHTILIANKKAEVGVNLHHGTSDMYHLTLPWTPASIDQRNGRGARVGSKSDSVRVHYLLGNGSFDEFRLSTLMRKKQWMTELFTKTDEKMKNADAVATSEEMSLLLAADPEERAARDEKARKAKEAQIRQEKQRIAMVDLANFIKASHDTKWNGEELQSEIKRVQDERLAIKEKIDEAEQKYGRLRYYHESEKMTLSREIANLKKDEKKLTNDLIALNRQAKRYEKSVKKHKQLKPQIEAAIKNGIIEVDESILENASNTLLNDGKLISAHKYYERKIVTGSGRNLSSRKEIVRVENLNFDLKQADVLIKWSSDRWRNDVGTVVSIPLYEIRSEVKITEDELSIKNRLQQEITFAEVAELLSKDKFVHYLESGELKIKGSYGLKLSDNGFETQSLSSAGAYADKLIYPDNTDKNLKAKIAKWLLLPDNRQYLRSYSLVSDFLEYMYGNNYSSTVEDYGNKASDEQIQQWINAEFKVKFTDDVKQEVMAKFLDRGYDFYIVNGIKDIFGTPPAEYDNHTRFKDLIEVFANGEKAKIVAAHNAEKAHLNELLKAEVAKQDALSFDAVKSRMDSLFVGSPYNIQDARAFVELDETGERSKYHQLNKTERIAALYSDFKRIGTTTHLSDDIAKSVKSTLSSEYTFYEGGHAWAKLKEAQNKPEPEPEVIQRAEVAEKLTTASNGTPDSINGVTVRLNAKEIDVPSRKVKQFGRWKTQRAVYYGAGDVYCLHDPRGKDGKLFEAKDAIKDLAGKGNYQYAADLNDDYPDSWWFIKTSAVTLEQLTELLED